MTQEHLTAPPILDPYVTASTRSPFSDRLMVFHKLDMFAMRVRAYGNALSFVARHDLVPKLGRMLIEAGKYAEDGANLLIERGWFEQPPQALDREALATK